MWWLLATVQNIMQLALASIHRANFNFSATSNIAIWYAKLNLPSLHSTISHKLISLPYCNVCCKMKVCAMNSKA